MNRPEILHSVVDALQNLQGSPVENALAERLLQPDGDIAIRELGLESLDAVEWCMEIEVRTGVDIDPATYSALERLSDLVTAIEARTATAKPAAPPVAAPGAPSPLSLSQERVWTYAQDPAVAARYVATRLTRLAGPLDVELVRDCIARLVARHDTLRTVFPLVDGKPVQVARPAGPLECPIHELPAGADPAAEAMQIARPMA
jgi:hypothetical protein